LNLHHGKSSPRHVFFRLPAYFLRSKVIKPLVI
jgi:hypothetical protein